jgi:hypothetical protein
MAAFFLRTWVHNGVRRVSGLSRRAGHFGSVKNLSHFWFFLTVRANGLGEGAEREGSFDFEPKTKASTRRPIGSISSDS